MSIEKDLNDEEMNYFLKIEKKKENQDLSFLKCPHCQSQLNLKYMTDFKKNNTYEIIFCSHCKITIDELVHQLH